MNKELIQKLVTETDVWCDQNCFGNPHYDQIWEEKFAELIVRECMAQCDALNEKWAKRQETRFKVRMVHGDMKAGCKAAKHAIMTHFGFEE